MKSAPIGNGNGISRVVWKPSISIKSSLNQNIDQPKTPGGQAWEGEDELPDEPELLKAEEEPFIPDPDKVLKAWNSYAASIEKIKPRVFSTLQNNLPVVTADGIVRVLLNTESQRDNFQKNIKSELLDYIRETSGMPMIDIVTEVVEQEKEGKKIYTDQDRLEYMMKKNPELGPLKTRFGLDFDD
ncbi:MAG: hypothetical protein R6W31_07130 [Bacteroidales bacterium]